MMADGPDAWTLSEPSRTSVLVKMMEAVQRWDLSTKRNINYRLVDMCKEVSDSLSSSQARVSAHSFRNCGETLACEDVFFCFVF